MLTGIEANDKGRRPGRVMAVGCLPFVIVAAVLVAGGVLMSRHNDR